RKRGVDTSGEADLVGRARVAADGVNMDAVVRDRARNTLVEHVDDAADSRRAIEQRGRAANDFDALRSDWIDGDSVIGGGVGHIDRADAVRQHADALALEAAQD